MSRNLTYKQFVEVPYNETVTRNAKNIFRMTGMSALSVALCLSLCFLFASPSFALAVEARDSETTIEVSRNGDEARMDGVAFGLSDFERLNKGTGKEYEGRSFGYRYPMASAEAFAVVVRDAHNALVYLPPPAAALLGPLPHEDFEAMLKALDTEVSHGGTMLASMDLSYEYTTERSVSRDGFRYDFAVEVEPGHCYATVTPDASSSASSAAPSADSDNATGALLCETGHIIDVAQVVIEHKPTGFAALVEFFSSLDLRPFWVSLKTSGVAMLFVFTLGLLAAWSSQRISTRLKGVLDSILTIPLVLPPTVCGFLLLVLFGNSTPLGRLLLEHGIELIFSWPAAVLAAVVVSFPLMYRTARGAFEGLESSLGDAARTLGWSEPRIFFRLTMPLAWPSIAAGTVLAFARAMGEFGATLFVAGNYPGVTQTMPIAIYFEWMGGHSDVATFWVFVVIAFSFVVILFVNWYASHTQRYRRASADEADEIATTGTSTTGTSTTGTSTPGTSTAGNTTPDTSTTGGTTP